MGYDRFTGKYTINGRGNLSPITIILPKIGLEYGIALGKREKPDLKGFFDKLDYTVELVGRELVKRTRYMMSQSPKSAPFIYDNNLVLDAEKSKDKDNVKETLKHGSNAVGILGMAECCVAMFGKHHGESVEAYKFALKIVRFIYNKCKEFSDRYDMNFGQYFSPAENLCKTACKRGKGLSVLFNRRRARRASADKQERRDKEHRLGSGCRTEKSGNACEKKLYYRRG